MIISSIEKTYRLGKFKLVICSFIDGQDGLFIGFLEIHHIRMKYQTIIYFNFSKITQSIIPYFNPCLGIFLLLNNLN